MDKHMKSRRGGYGGVEVPLFYGGHDDWWRSEEVEHAIDLAGKRMWCVGRRVSGSPSTVSTAAIQWAARRPSE